MLRWLKRRLPAWAEEYQRRKITRLRQESIRLQEQLERETGKSVELTPEEQRKLAEMANEIDPDTLRQMSVFDSDDLTPPDRATDSSENRKYRRLQLDSQ